ncbi:MAG: ABC transporter substrate-binding protein [Firmicutes bacterium]|nr:ABC transporter substrate-binding protein [Dethiobacter sp.]MBS3888954.1 ABC transporter substrate-binding protein [Bacillota bacterium]MBS4054280.1 ABC transporter substrate-binding protein [Thermaerobacter sp.]
MSRRLLAVFALCTMLLGSLALVACQRRVEVRDIVLSEVIHSIFFAPQYVALHKGFFMDEGLNVRLEVAGGADRGAAALLSGSAHIALFGTEAAIYTFKQGAANPIVAFAQLTQRDGSFLVGRNADPDFTWEDVRGKTIIGGRRGGVPQMVLEHILRRHNITPQVDVTIIQNIGLGATAAAFREGTGDFVQLWEPTASTLIAAGTGNIVTALGEYSGKLPYTVFHATQSFIKENPAVLEQFTRAIYRAQRYVAENEAEVVARAIAPSFPEMTLEQMTAIIARYQALDIWAASPLVQSEAVDHLQNIMIEAGELDTKVPFTQVVNNTFAERAMRARR